MKWFISDTHFNHAKTITHFEFRPFKDVNHMNEQLIKNWNERVNPEDEVYFLGDFCFKGNYKQWEKQLNGKIIYIRGNHDNNNGLNTIITHVMAEFGNKVVLMQHIPPMMKAEIPDFCDFVLCGHVHSVWKHMFIDGIPVINCSVEQWNYKPIRLDEIIAYYDKIMKEYIK